MKIIPDWIFSVRSLVTLILTIGFFYMTLKGQISAEAYIGVLIITINFYFKEKVRKDE